MHLRFSAIFTDGVYRFMIREHLQSAHSFLLLSGAQVINGCSLATLKEQWAIAHHLPGATADFSPELTKQAQARESEAHVNS